MADSTTISGLDNLGRCVDLVYLDPMDIVSSSKSYHAIDPDPAKTKKQGEFEIPQGIDLASPYKLEVTGGDTVMTNSYDFTKSFENSVTVDGGFGGFEFSASKSVKGVQKESESREEVFTYVFACSAIHVATMDLDEPEDLKINARFARRVSALPDQEGDAYTKLIADFGTHFYSQLSLGGMAWSKVSSNKREYSKSDEQEKTFTTTAKAALEKFTAGVSKTDSEKQVAQRDQSLGIKRSSITFVGGTGSTTELSDKWVDSLDAKSVPVFDRMQLTRLSALLAKDYFADDAAIGTKKNLLDAAITSYLKQRGADEGGHIVYGKPIQLIAFYGKRRIMYKPDRSGFLPLWGPNADSKPRPGASEATFEIQGPNKQPGQPVLTGDLVNLKICEANAFTGIKLMPKTWGDDQGKLIPTLQYDLPSPRDGGEFMFRLRDSGQKLIGQSSKEKTRPLMAGDIVTISEYCKEIDKFVVMFTDATGVACGNYDKDVTMAPDQDTADKIHFIVKNA